TMVVGGVLLSLMALMAIFAPYLGTVDPQALSPIKRLRWPSAQYWFGTDMLGRDIYSRTLYGARVSLIVGISVALLASAIVMRIMDGLMSIQHVSQDQAVQTSVAQRRSQRQRPSRPSDSENDSGEV